MWWSIVLQRWQRGTQLVRNSQRRMSICKWCNSERSRQLCSLLTPLTDMWNLTYVGFSCRTASKNSWACLKKYFHLEYSLFLPYIPPDCNLYKIKVLPICYRMCTLFFSAGKGYAWKTAIWHEENQLTIYYLFHNYALTTACPKTTASCWEASKSLRRKGQSLPISKYTY